MEIQLDNGNTIANCTDNWLIVLVTEMHRTDVVHLNGNTIH